MLHVITPHHPTTSASLVGLMRLAIRQLHNEKHHIIVIGCEQDATHLRHQGFPVLGSVDGSLDASRTLRTRLLKYVESAQFGSYQNIMAWGWHATAVTSNCVKMHDVYAIIDEVDFEQICDGDQTIIATSTIAMNQAIQLGYSSHQFTEPLIGIEPIAMVVDSQVVHDSMNICKNELLVSIVGDVGSWQEIVQMAVRLRGANVQAVFVLPSTYRDHTLLMRAAKSHGVLGMMLDTPSSLRNVDVLRSSDCAWCPATATFDVTCNVLDVLNAAWEAIPLAVPHHHPVGNIPTIGSKIAWVKNEIEVFGWLLNSERGNNQFEAQIRDRVSTLRAIATPARFIEGLQMRMHSFV